MKYLMIAILAVLLASPVYAELLTEKEALAQMQSEMDEFYRNPPLKLSAEERRKRDLQHSIEENSVPKNFYNGSGSYVSDRDVYIDGKLYHCVQYQFNTQCHID